MSDTTWQLPFAGHHFISASAAHLTFVGGAGDFDGQGTIRHPGDLEGQVEGAMSNLAAALAAESCGLGDVVRLKVFYRSAADDGGADRDDGVAAEWALLARLAAAFEDDPLPAISLLPVPLQPFAGQELQVQAIAQRGWRGFDDIRVVSEPAPERHAAAFQGRPVTWGLRAGELISVPLRTAAGDDAATAALGEGVPQTHAIMTRMGETLAALGASFQDSIKKEGYYFGTTRPQWAEMAAVRASYFKEPGPVATMVPGHILWPAGSVTKIELLAMRQKRLTYDKYIPRDDSWPDRVWDWPLNLPYRQGTRLRDTIWLGGQVPAPPFAHALDRVLPAQLVPQTRLTMSYIEDLLRGFGRRPADLKLLIAYFTSDGTPEATATFLDTVAACVDGPLPPITVVPQPHMHTPETMVEIWGIAQG